MMFVVQSSGLIPRRRMVRMKLARHAIAVLIGMLALTAVAQPGPMDLAGLLIREQKWEEAERVLENVVREEPANAMAWMQLARAYDARGKHDEMIDAARKAIDAGFQAPRIAMIVMARGYAAKGNAEAALTTIDEIAEGGPNRVLARRLEAAPGLEEIKGDPRWTAAITALTPCAADEYRQFDFWLGDFRVEDPGGNHVGDNEITLHLDGCLLMESWKGLGGMHGMSMNFYDPTDGTWNQIFLDNNGAPRNWPALKGKLENGAMVLMSAEGETRTRWTWTKVSDDRVRQMAERTADGGATWQVIWDSYYVRK
jgi:tetratricopeptide (TPR) repeat protein